MGREFNIKINGLREFEKALRRNPLKTKDEIGKLLVRSISELNRVIIRKPWKIGQGGGGSPVATGNLRDTHQRRIRPLEARIFPTAKYAPFVHGEGKGGKMFNKRGLQLRPWLDHAIEKTKGPINKLSIKMLNNIVKDLTK